MTECKINWIGYLIIVTTFVLFAILGIIGIIPDTTSQIITVREILSVVLLLTSGLGGITVCIFLVPNIKINIDKNGIHGKIAMVVGSINVFSRIRTIEWERVERFEWFNSGYIRGFLVLGKDQLGKRGYLGPSIFYTNAKDAARRILDYIPKHKIDETIYSKLRIMKNS